ncbi:DUF6034 family protein [Christensenella intestinihominis]|uniref:DUF6034 family protein n=1 Tax=Christensenella intestinihominis TaxID=1851429 RepID=UPI00082F9DC8|nr:DUF6034 family protein [Christensenella intestinihominis]
MRKYLSIVCACILSAAFLLAGCQPTPEKRAVVQKNDGSFEKAVGETADTPYETPARYENELSGAAGVSIRFAADVEPSGLAAYPVYSVRPAPFTQEQVDSVLDVLLGGETLYENNTEQRSRDEIQRDIDYYTEELAACGDNPEFADAAATYKQWLKDFMVEYENAPEQVDLKEAERTLKFNENDLSLQAHYGEEQPTENEGETRIALTEEGKRRAEADGNTCVTGVFWKELGGKTTKMQFVATNHMGELGNGMDSSLYCEPYESGIPQVPTSLTQEEAEKIARDALAQMEIDAVPVSTQREAVIDWEDNEDGTADPIDRGAACYAVTFRHNVPGTVQRSIFPANMHGEEEDFAAHVPNETIVVRVNGDGIVGFSWDNPMEVAEVENENTPLLPFEEVVQRMEEQVRNVTANLSMGDPESDGQRVQVDRLTLSYLMTRKPDSTDEYYFIPVWDAVGNIFYHYADDYPDNTSNHYVVDENRERAEYNMDELWGQQPVSLVTLNAIDGSVVKRSYY